MMPFDFQGKALRFGSVPLLLKAKAYCRADPSIWGYVDREGVAAIRAQERVEIFVKDKETPKTISFRRRTFMAGALALVESEAATPAVHAGVREARSAEA